MSGKENPQNEMNVVPSGTKIFVTQSSKREPDAWMMNAEGVGPAFVHPVQPPMKVTLDEAQFPSAEGLITYVDSASQRCWVTYLVPGQIRPGYTWVSCADFPSPVTIKVESDLTSQGGPSEPVNSVTSMTLDHARNLVNGTLMVDVSTECQEYAHPVYPEINNVFPLLETVTGVRIYSKSQGTEVPVTVRFVDGSKIRFKAEYLVQGEQKFKWLLGSKFTPPIAIRQ